MLLGCMVCTWVATCGHRLGWLQMLWRRSRDHLPNQPLHVALITSLAGPCSQEWATRKPSKNHAVL